ncbi:aspartate kinase [Virgibacillus kekensis]|uniref:Aspartokinase n=1 Tax=Virgibacillus kekensis TaxID=202261 RepID=A0ABV9DGJ6_9BACI
MAIAVQKFGGTSLQTPDGRAKAVEHVKAAVERNAKLVVVVSAIGRNPDPYATDTLLSLIGSATLGREKDLLMSCGETIAGVVLTDVLRTNGINATTLTGAQAGIRTTGDHLQAEIEHVDTTRIRKELGSHDAVVVAGFQGQTTEGEVTTIGRGGSDTTAAALGVALQAEKVEIFTDVNGIMTADPQMVSTAKLLTKLTYSDVCNLANQGAKVIHPRAVEIAMKATIPLYVRSTYDLAGGTLITAPENKGLPDQPIIGITHASGMSQISVRGRGAIQKVRTVMQEEINGAGIPVEVATVKDGNLLLTVSSQHIGNILQRLRERNLQPEIVDHCARIAVIGNGLDDHLLLSRMTTEVSEQGIKVLQAKTSETSIRMVVVADELKRAVTVLHDRFCVSGFARTEVR